MNMYTCIGYLWQFLLATVCCMENEHGNFTKMKMFDNSSLRLDDDMHWHGGLLSLFLVSRNQIRFRVYSTRLILVGSEPLTVWRHANTPRLSTNSMICFPFSSSLMGTERRHVDEPFVVSVYSDFFS